MAARAFGKYEVLARLATGGAASIFLARQAGAAGFSKLVCLKTLLPERAADEDFVAMFLDEARLAARLNHPACVQIYDLGRVRGVYFISMEYIFGDTLWNLLTTVTKVKTPLPPAAVAAIMAAACDGLHHAHELKDPQGKPYHLVHRDISPQNIMITYEGQTKVVDFGIAKAETGRAATVAGIVKGKFSYMSPEQITGGAVDRRSDIFALGIVMFECLASRRLYRGDTPEEIAKLILEHRAPRLRDVVPDIPPALDDICATALMRHASKRFPTAQAMADAIRVYLDEVRHAQSPLPIARLMEERFSEVIEARRRVYERVFLPEYDEEELMRVFDARPVRELDLFHENAPPVPDFAEESSESLPPRRVSVPRRTSVVPAGRPASDYRHEGVGFRVELTGNADAPSPISMLPEDSFPEIQGGESVIEVTSLDPDPEPDKKTVFDPRRPGSGNDHAPLEPAPPSRAVTGLADTLVRKAEAEAAWSNEHTKDTVDGPLRRDPEVAPVPVRPLSDLGATPPDKTKDSHAPIRVTAASNPVVTPARISVTPAPDNLRPLTPGPLIAPVSGSDGRRYTVFALAMALGAGLIIGLIAGIVLAKAAISAAPPVTRIDVTRP